jgi:hypothetical protein
VCDDPAARLHELTTRMRAALPGADMDAPRTSPQGEVQLHRALSYPVSDLASPLGSGWCGYGNVKWHGTTGISGP